MDDGQTFHCSIEGRPFFICRINGGMPVLLPPIMHAPIMLPRPRRRAMVRIEAIFTLAVLVFGQTTQAFTSWRSPAHDVPHSLRIRAGEVDIQQSSSIGALWAVPKGAGNRSANNNQGNNTSNQKQNSKKQHKKSKKNPATFTTLSDLSAALRSDPAALRDTQAKNRSKRKSAGGAAKKGRTRRSVRERGERPQQVYVTPPSGRSSSSNWARIPM